jgi:hypothetical protein
MTAGGGALTFADTFIELSDRFLCTRTFELIVAPAIADLQYDEATGSRATVMRNRAAVAWAFALGLYEDAVTASSLLTFAALALLPAIYYAFLIITVAPTVETLVNRFTLGAIIGVLSLGPVIACYWPERPARRIPADNP